MGVQGLWELLAPVGRRVSVETLAGKKVAIDASIWLVQFIKAMRDEKGEMLRNAHLLGFFRRICKLLFLRTRPVFVFDGGTPALKRRTIAARRRQRENAAAKIRKTAEKLLLNHLKAKKLEELAEEIKSSGAKDDSKGKTVIAERIEHRGEDNEAFSCLNQEELDEMLAASIAAEEEGMFIGREERSTGQKPGKEESDDDESEELAIPLGSDRLDPAVLASLPPSMQLDLLVQMRERLMAENRQKYQKIKKSPSKFSELQIQSYLKTVAFRRDIDQVQRVAAGKGPEGLQTFRIASEANREFVFSSSFTGDKKKFTPTECERTSNGTNTELSSGNAGIPEDSSRVPLSSDQRSKGESTQDFGPDVETYRDERGRMRVNRVRGLGMRMTRDLKHNLDVVLKNDCNNNNGDVVHQNGAFSAMEASPMEVSFSVDVMDGDDEIFSQLVTGKSMVQSPLESFSLRKDSAFASDVDWEEQPVEEKSANRSVLNESDGLDWEDGEPLTGDSDKFVPRELSEEESQIQEAIKRSLEDFGQQSYKGILLQKHPAAGSSTISREIDVHGGLQDGESEIQVDSEGTPKSFDQQSPNRTLPCGSSPIARRDNVRVDLEEEESDIQKTIKRSLDDADIMKDFPRGSQGDETEINEEIQRNHEDFNQNLSNETLNFDSSRKKTEIDSTPISPPCNKPTSSRQIIQEVDGLISSPESPPTSTTRLCESIQDEDVSKQFTLYESKNDDNDAPSTSTISFTPLDERNSGINDGTKVHNSASRSPEKFITSSDKVLETAPEEEYKLDSSVHQNIMFHEAISSELGEELSHLSHECKDLGDQQRKLERNAESVSSEMFAECQELLQMFGLPFIIAPMEAEAQCAYMEMMNLVDGIVTDDSDAFLFGAQNVYKNIFDDRKYVETYLMKDIEHELGLTREKLIHMALLLGSDYTEGISGIGIVNAIEVVHAFPEEDGLREFREWVESPDPLIFGKLYPHIGDDAKRHSRDKLGSSKGDKGDKVSDVKMTFMEKHRNVSKNWHIPDSFPSGSVISAYINPQVDASTDPFSWGKPDLPLLRRLCWEKFGWADQKANEVLVPVLKEYNKHETQLRMEAFYTFNERFAKIRSQRIKRAVKGITGKGSKDIMMDPEDGSTMKGKKRRKSSPEALEEENRELKQAPKSGRERGRGRRGRGADRGRKLMEVEDGGMSDSSDYSPQEGCQVDVTSTSSQLRRSTRQRINISKESVEVSPSDEESQLSPDQPSSVNGTSSYLQAGGGFCLDEDESPLSLDQPRKGNDDESEEIPSEEVVGSGKEVGSEGTQSVNFHGEEEGMDFSFTPMSSLRRKRR